MKVTQTFTNAPGGTIYINYSKRDFSNVQNNGENEPLPKRRRRNDQDLDQADENGAAEVVDGNENNNENLDRMIVYEPAQHQFNANGPVPPNFQARVLLQRINHVPQQQQQSQRQLENNLIRPSFEEPRNFVPEISVNRLIDRCIENNVAIDGVRLLTRTASLPRNRLKLTNTCDF